MVKFADDTSLSGLIQEGDSSYREAVEELIEWCDRNYLDLNVTKTKELVINFRRAKVNMDPIVIRGQPVEITNYKYLGTIIDNKLDWLPNIEACCKKANQRMYFLRKLKQFKIEMKILARFYQSSKVPCSTIRCATSATPRRQTRNDWTRLQRLWGLRQQRQVPSTPKVLL